MTAEQNVQFTAPTWLRNLGFSSWLLVGFVLIIVGLIWLLAETSTIVMPVILATVLGAVAGPAVGWLCGIGARTLPRSNPPRRRPADDHARRRPRRRSWIWARSVSHRERASAVT